MDACIANGQTHEDVFHPLSGSVGNYLQLGWILAVLFLPPAIPLMLLHTKQTCSQISLPTDSLLSLEDETPCPTTRSMFLYTTPTRFLVVCPILNLRKEPMADGCPSPFLHRPLVFTFAHLYYLPHFALLCYTHRHHPSGSSLQPSCRCRCRCHASPSDQARATLSDQTSPSHTRMDIVVTADNDCLTKIEPRGVYKFEILGRLRCDF